MKCVICSSNCRNGDVKALNFQNNNLKRIERLACGHIFHRECIAMWEEVNNECPLCRHAIRVLPVRYSFPESVVEALSIARILGVTIDLEEMSGEQLAHLDQIDVMGMIVKSVGTRTLSQFLQQP